MIEQHPYLSKYPLKNGLKYLIIGTMPPSSIGKCKREFSIDYFYGNEGSLWAILQPLYSDYNFAKREEILKWQQDFNIGLTDTVKQCKRTDICSSFDKDLNLTKEDYNYDLREYVANNICSLERFYFTSCSGKFNAFKNFEKIMGKDLSMVDPSRIIKLPSPSGSANTALFKGNPEKFGLIDDFYAFLKESYPKALLFAQKTWTKKMDSNGEKVKRLPEDRKYASEYKRWFYRKYFPNKTNE